MNIISIQREPVISAYKGALIASFIIYRDKYDDDGEYIGQEPTGEYLGNARGFVFENRFYELPNYTDKRFVLVQIESTNDFGHFQLGGEYQRRLVTESDAKNDRCQIIGSGIMNRIGFLDITNDDKCVFTQSFKFLVDTRN